MSLLVTGSIGIDTVTTPYGHVEDVLGGSAVYFSYAASHYGPVRLVAAAGEDLPQSFRDLLAARDIDLAGLEIRAGSKTFRWEGRFDGDMNEARTVAVSLNVLEEAPPRVPDRFKDSAVVFLANTHPVRQLEVLGQLAGPRVVVCDTFDLWIKTQRDALMETLKAVHGIIINDVEARQLTGIVNLIEAGEKMLTFGPRFAVIKKGEHGAILVTAESATAVPAFPTKLVRDPTGAGDSFAGGFMGYLASVGVDHDGALRQAMVRGTVAASFAIEDFSLNRVRDVTRQEIDRRVQQYLGMLTFV